MLDTQSAFRKSRESQFCMVIRIVCEVPSQVSINRRASIVLPLYNCSGKTSFTINRQRKTAKISGKKLFAEFTKKCKSHLFDHRSCKTAKINFYYSHTETTSSSVGTLPFLWCTLTTRLQEHWQMWQFSLSLLQVQQYLVWFSASHLIIRW
jgi:hypothetical protein